MEDVVQKMRADVSTSAVGKDVNSFRVSYVSDEPEKARKVTERLASLYIEQNLKDRENQADSTSQFLNTQLEEAKRRLIEQEKKLEEYRKSHAGQLPSQLQGNLQASQTASLQLQSLNESMNRAQERRLLIERQIADSKAVPVPAASANPEGAAPVGTAQQLEIARARLALALQRYTPSHPEVVSLERTIADLVAKLESETPVGAAPAEQKKPVTPAEAEQQKRILDFQAELAVIDYQVAANRTEAARLNNLIAEYQAKIDVVPTRESELVELTRDYSTMQAAYTNLLVKREDAMLAANLERRQIGEQFKLLDTASLPGTAVQSNAAPRHHDLRRGGGIGAGPFGHRIARVSRFQFQDRSGSGKDALDSGLRADSRDDFGPRTARGKAARVGHGRRRYRRSGGRRRRFGHLASPVVRESRDVRKFLRLIGTSVRAHRESKVPLSVRAAARSAQRAAIRTVLGEVAHVARSAMPARERRR